ncbi:MAG: Ig-like domain-containing protein [Bacteroidales bacterium]|nr:Ig-like domain-containing protein [Bacteroidales bacterium]
MNRLTKYLPLIPAALVLGAMMLPSGCANTTTPPSGGPKDTIPPVLVKTVPFPGTTNMPVHKTQIKFTFDEYVVVKEANNIFLSPPLEKKPKYRISGKSIIVTFESDLDTNTTYTLDITGAIADNNEGNMYEGFTYVFSTGDHIDSMCVTGTVQDCNSLVPIKNATVLLYKDHADSAVLKHRPDAAAKTDDWGFFSLRNIKDTVYRVYAIRDANNNNIYDPDQESVAFLDSVFRPVTVFNDSIYEFKKFDMKDTALCLARKSELELNVFREKPSKQMIMKKERVGLRTAHLTFMAPDTKINSMKFRGLPKEKLISQFNLQRDSLELWVNDQRKMPDTLFLQINYDKTDTNGRLVPTDELVKLALDKKLRAELQKSSRRDIKHEDTVAVFTSVADGSTIEQYGFQLEFKYPLIESAWDSLKFRSVNPRQQESIGKVSVTQDSTNLRRFTVMPQEKLQPGYDYYLKIPYRKFRDVNGFYNDSTELKVSLPNDEKLSTLLMEVSGVKNKYIIDLLNEKRDKVIRSFIIDSDRTVVFPYLKTGNYCLRITEDVNRNNIVDSGVLLAHRQPEKVKFFKLDDKFLINIPERSELVQQVNLEELFR